MNELTELTEHRVELVFSAVQSADQINLSVKALVAKPEDFPAYQVLINFRNFRSPKTSTEEAPAAADVKSKEPDLLAIKPDVS